MHENRILYTLPEYQSIFKENAEKFVILLRDTETNEEFFFKPNPRSLWVEEYQSEYLKSRKGKMYHALKDRSYDFLTITYWDKIHTVKQACDRHKSDIKRFIRNVRKIRSDIQYCYTIEVTDRNYIHFHIFIESGITEKTYRRIWRGITKSYIVKKTVIGNNKKLINYVNKYISKIADGNESKLDFMYKNIDRFFGCSRSFYTNRHRVNEKGRYKLICNLFIDSDISDLIYFKGKNNRICGANELLSILIQENSAILFKESENGGVYASAEYFQDDSDLINYYKLFHESGQNSFCYSLTNEIPILYTPREK